MPRAATTDRPHSSIQPTYHRPVEQSSSSLALVRPWTDDLTHRNKALAEPETWGLSPLEESFRHGFWAKRRARIYDALQLANVSPRRLANFAACGAGAVVKVRAEDGQIAVEANHCHDRFCQACGQARATQLQVALAERVPQAKCLHVVLTLRSSDRPLAVQLDHLYKSAAKLRSRKWWRSRVAGGMASCELTRNATTGQWHPHLHLLVHAEWLAQPELSAEWAKASGGSTIVHVSLVERHANAIREVTKYVTKPVHRSIDFDPDSLVQLIRALLGRHLVLTFGTWRSDPLIVKDQERTEGNWRVWGTLNQLHAAAAAGDTWAREALRYLSSLAPGRQKVDPPSGAPPG